jgi:hypothetical protein
MNLSKYSKNRVMETFKHWNVPRDFAEPMYNYLVHGYYPGSCFTSVLANDFLGAMFRSHPSNTIDGFKKLAGWMTDTIPKQAQGSYGAVEDWTKLGDDERRTILEKHDLIYISEEETWMILKDEPVKEVVLY